MKPSLYYCTSDSTSKGEGINLCTDFPIQKAPFYILPGKQKSYIKIFPLPPVPEKRLHDMVRYQVQTMYPGNFEGICFDYISYRKGKKWQIVLYFLKKNSVTAVCRNRKCRGIVLPLQLVPKKTLQTISSLVIIYPDMTEVWELKQGIPRSITRFDRQDFYLSRLSEEGKRMVISQLSKNVLISPSNKGAIHTTFLKAARSGGLKQKYFLEFKKVQKDILTPALTITAFILSLFLLMLTLTEYRNTMKESTRIYSYSKKVRNKAAAVKIRLQTIHSLEETLRKREEQIPANIYSILYRLRKTIDDRTTITSFTFSKQEISLSCSSKNALETLKKLQGEFSTVHISGIIPNKDGMELYTIKLETGK